MFLLFLIGLGTADVNAQVRIGGNAAPQGAAVLDLNADNTATPAANKGALALPRVRLDSTTMRLNGTAPINGMLVWNTNTTLGTGVYFWSGTAWVKANLPATVPTDSGRYLMSNGSQWIPSFAEYVSSPAVDTLSLSPVAPIVTFTRIIDTTFNLSAQLPRERYTTLYVPNVLNTDICFNGASSTVMFKTWQANRIIMYNPMHQPLSQGMVVRLICFRASI